MSLLTDPTTTIIFAASPTGLGHLRVTDALYHGLPKDASPLLLGAQDPAVSAFYRFVSIHPLTRKIMELVQVPPLDRPFADIIRRILHTQTKILHQQVKTILGERITVPQTVLFILPHTILGHQLAAIKQQLAAETGSQILMVVQVTDDSPQAVWYVPEADLIVAPSQYTKEKLLSYAKKAKLPPVPIVVASYPISPKLTEELTPDSFTKRYHQVDPEGTAKIHMTVPVSGAAVGTSFMSSYINDVRQLSDRFLFHIISREAGYTAPFLKTMSRLPFVKLYTANHDRTTVANYERVFQEEVVALELTKPSEQTFKALATPRQRGGAILLFSRPVGGQEYDNLHFLRTHGLMPDKHRTSLLWDLAASNEKLPEEVLQKSHHWRGLRLPDNPEEAACFTMWCLSQKLFLTMMHYSRAQESEETTSHGVAQFWQQVEKLLEQKKKL